MTREEWIKIYNAKDGTWDKDDLIDKAYEIITSPINTNYDRIKSMSVEKMAEFATYCAEDLIKDITSFECTHCEEKHCTKCIKQWLLQEVSDE